MGIIGVRKTNLCSCGIAKFQHIFPTEINVLELSDSGTPADIMKKAQNICFFRLHILNKGGDCLGTMRNIAAMGNP